jgi:hypothetical protein
LAIIKSLVITSPTGQMASSLKTLLESPQPLVFLLNYSMHHAWINSVIFNLLIKIVFETINPCQLMLKNQAMEKSKTRWRAFPELLILFFGS